VNLTTREALSSFRRTRTLSILSVTTIAFALFVTGLFGLIALNLHTALQQVAERVQVVAFVKRDTPSQQISAAMADIAVFPEHNGISPSFRRSTRTSRPIPCRHRSSSPSSRHSAMDRTPRPLPSDCADSSSSTR
jgi:hypothetical protein